MTFPLFSTILLPSIFLLPLVLSFSFYIDPIEVIYDISISTTTGNHDFTRHYTRAHTEIAGHPPSLAYDSDRSTYYQAAPNTTERLEFYAELDGMTSVTLLTAGGSNNQFSLKRPLFFTYSEPGQSRVIIGVSCQEITLAFNDSQFDRNGQNICKLASRTSTPGPTVKLITTYEYLHMPVTHLFADYRLLPSDVWIYDSEHMQVIKYSSTASKWEYVSVEDFAKYFSNTNGVVSTPPIMITLLLRIYELQP
jgi:hypothetical protein